MAYLLQAAIAPEPAAAELARLVHGAAVGLPGGFALVPIGSERLAALAGLRQDEVAGPPLIGGGELPPALVAALAEASRLGPVAYLEIETSGAPGERAAAAWEDGDLVLGPVVQREWRTGEPFARLDLVTNEVLRRVGVVTADGARDEFDTLGLGSRRFTEAWR